MDYGKIVDQFGATVEQLAQGLLEVLPNLVGAVLLVIVGLLAARLLRIATYRLLRKLDGMLPGRNQEHAVHSRKLHQTAHIVSHLLFWMVVFLFVTAATEVLGIPVVTVWLKGLTTYLPNLLAFALITAAGFIGGTLARDLTAAAAHSAGLGHGTLFGKAVQYAVVTISLLVAVNQLGIDITFITWIIAIILASILFGAALAFGLGARTAVSNILAAYYLQKTYRVGQYVRIGKVEGRIFRFLPNAVILETEEGHALVPAHLFQESASSHLERIETKP